MGLVAARSAIEPSSSGHVRLRRFVFWRSKYENYAVSLSRRAAQTCRARQYSYLMGNDTQELSNDIRNANCCVSLRSDYEGEAKSRVAWRSELTLPKTSLIYLL
eukprot:1718556-Pleurochrysis_carterae.AAC.1